MIQQEVRIIRAAEAIVVSYAARNPADRAKLLAALKASMQALRRCARTERRTYELVEADEAMNPLAGRKTVGPDLR